MIKPEVGMVFTMYGLNGRQKIVELTPCGRYFYAYSYASRYIGGYAIFVFNNPLYNVKLDPEWYFYNQIVKLK